MVPAVSDPAVAGALLQLICLQEPANGYNVLLLFSVRIVIAIILTLLVATGLQWAGVRRRR